jgi:hypothetical protein
MDIEVEKRMLDALCPTTKGPMLTRLEQAQRDRMASRISTHVTMGSIWASLIGPPANEFMLWLILDADIRPPESVNGLPTILQRISDSTITSYPKECINDLVGSVAAVRPELATLAENLRTYVLALAAGKREAFPLMDIAEDGVLQVRLESNKMSLAERLALFNFDFPGSDHDEEPVVVETEEAGSVDSETETEEPEVED